MSNPPKAKFFDPSMPVDPESGCPDEQKEPMLQTAYMSQQSGGVTYLYPVQQT